MSDETGALGSKDQSTSGMAAKSPPAVTKQAWGLPLVRLDAKWTSFESRLCVWVLLAEIVALCFWIALKGLSSEYSSGGGDVSGLVFRSLITSVLLAFIAHKATKPKVPTPEYSHRRAWIVTLALF